MSMCFGRVTRGGRQGAHDWGAESETGRQNPFGTSEKVKQKHKPEARIPFSFFFLPIFPPRSCILCCPSECTHKPCGSGHQGDITYCAGNAAVSLLLLTASAMHSFLHFFCFTLQGHISTVPLNLLLLKHPPLLRHI